MSVGLKGYFYLKNGDDGEGRSMMQMQGNVRPPHFFFLYVFNARSKIIGMGMGGEMDSSQVSGNL
jgi:hypothetical protein